MYLLEWHLSNRSLPRLPDKWFSIVKVFKVDNLAVLNELPYGWCMVGKDLVYHGGRHGGCLMGIKVCNFWEFKFYG